MRQCPRLSTSSTTLDRWVLFLHALGTGLCVAAHPDAPAGSQRPRQEIHAYLPITFSSTHLCVLDCTVHSCLTDVRFKAPAPAAPVPEPSRKLFGGLTLTPGRQRARSSPAPVGRADGTPAPADADGEHDVGVMRATSMPRSPTFHETADGHKAIVDPTARSLRGYLFGASAEAITDRQVRIVSSPTRSRSVPSANALGMGQD